MTQFFIGIDPGKNGGICVICGSPPRYMPYSLAFFGENAYELFDFLVGLSSPSRAYCVLENVHSMPFDGVRSAFTFGREFGRVQAIVEASEIPLELVTPLQWQTEFGLKRKPNETKTQKKNRHKALAQEICGQKLTHSTADAVLIAEWCRRRKG